MTSKEELARREGMERLTTNKNTSEMGMYELAMNNCYSKDGFKTLVFDDYGVDKLQKINPQLKIEDIEDMLAEYDLKKEAYEKGLADASKNYNQGLIDAWELAKKLWLPERYGGIHVEKIQLLFGCAYHDIFKKYTVQDALAKIEAYEKSQQIQVGDVVRRISDNEEYLIITRENDDSIYEYGVVDLRTMTVDRITGVLSMFEKTGRHIDIEHILEQIRGDALLSAEKLGGVENVV